VPPYEFKLPDLGEGLTEGEVARWLVAEGQEIGEDDPLVEIQTDKTTVEIPSPAAGKVARILVAEGETVAVGTVLVVIGEANGHAGEAAVASSRHRERRLSGASPAGEHPRAEEPPVTSPRQAPGHASAGQRVRATPLVRRLAQELGVELETLDGSGPQGRVTEDDVRSAAASPSLALGDAPEGRREPLRGVRKLIAEHMARAHAEVPPVTWVEECDFGAVDLKRLVPLTLKAVAEALQEVPELNARLEGDEIVYLARYDLGVAVQTDQSRDADSPVAQDEGIRPETTPDTLAKLPAAFSRDGTITAGNASQLADGAAALLVTSAERAEALGLQPLAEILTHGMCADRFSYLHTVPAIALNKALEKAGLDVNALGLLEINEAFASVALHATRMLGASEEVVNVNGGSVALGHALGSTGARMAVTLVHEINRRGTDYGAATLCGGGGQGYALILARPGHTRGTAPT